MNDQGGYKQGQLVLIKNAMPALYRLDDDVPIGWETIGEYSALYLQMTMQCYSIGIGSDLKQVRRILFHMCRALPLR